MQASFCFLSVTNQQSEIIYFVISYQRSKSFERDCLKLIELPFIFADGINPHLYSTIWNDIASGKRTIAMKTFLVYTTCHICKWSPSIISVLLGFLNIFFSLLGTQIKRKVYTLFLIPLFHMSPDRTSKTRYAGLTISVDIIQS